GVPQLDRPVEAGRGDLLSVGGPGHAVDRADGRRGVGGDLTELLSLGHVPDADVAIVPARGQLAAAGVKGDAIDQVGVAEVADRVFGRELPDLDRAVRAARVEAVAVGGINDGRCGSRMGERLERLAEGGWLQAPAWHGLVFARGRQGLIVRAEGE